ncbi:flagellar biosynthesis protein FlhB [Saccharobesus litoralis]|uniref:Flagellar biosynthetic protein FlhB n=1 Tax=Saccharobesus litoralis TaxID=2172099 RepID=A0A2S0VT72_9ALTE|nr:flagellar biosynthesis protein FlhB [Saccharobesus litoralis]AWB67382.1 flagellar biosynthesis protein FlhB [Saccharobesus litoralis]
MAAENEGKTEDPTEKKKSKSREKGQVARSKELATFLQLLGAAIFFLLWGGFIAEAMYKVMKHGLVFEQEDAFDPSRMFIRLQGLLDPVIAPLAAFTIVMMIIGVLSSIVVGGYNFSMQAAAPKFNKLNPITGLQRMFGPQGLVQLVQSLAKFLVVVIAAYVLVGFYFDKLLHINIEKTPNNIKTALEILVWIFIWLAFSLIVVAIIDVPYQLYKHNDSLKMTKQEVKDEHKNAEGDQQVKSKIRQKMFQASQRRMMAEVPKADVVVTNPTHYAVAIKYDTETASAPILLAKGVDEVAGHIRDIASAHDIPILCSPMLARSIYHTTELDAEIPEKLFTAVAQILAYVYQLKQYKKGKGKRPKEPTSNLPIPPEVRY